MCDSLQPAVGFNWGARNIQRVKAIEKRCYTAAIILALATTGVLALFPRQIAGLFITGDSDPAYLEMAVHALVPVSYTHLVAVLVLPGQQQAVEGIQPGEQLAAVLQENWVDSTGASMAMVAHSSTGVPASMYSCLLYTSRCV